MKIVIVHHLNDAQHYLFGVPEERDLKKDDLVLVRNSRGECRRSASATASASPKTCLSSCRKCTAGRP